MGVDTPLDLHRSLLEVARLLGPLVDSRERRRDSLGGVSEATKNRLSLDRELVSSRSHVFDLSSEQIH